MATTLHASGDTPETIPVSYTPRPAVFGVLAVVAAGLIGITLSLVWPAPQALWLAGNCALEAVCICGTLWAMAKRRISLAQLIRWSGTAIASVSAVIVSPVFLPLSIIYWCSTLLFSLINLQSTSIKAEMIGTWLGCLVVMIIAFAPRPGIPAQPMAIAVCIVAGGSFGMAGILRSIGAYHNKNRASIEQLHEANQSLIHSRDELDRRVQARTLELQNAHDLLEDRVESRTRELQQLLEMARVVSSTIDFGSLLDTILEQLRQVVDYEGAGVMALDDAGQFSVLRYRGRLLPRAARLSAPVTDTLYREHVVRTQKPLIIHDVREEPGPLADSWRAFVTRCYGGHIAFINTWMGVPLVSRGKVIGLLSLTHPEAGHFTYHHADIAMMFANQVAIAMEMTQLHESSVKAAAYAERNRLARELHDSVSQALFGVSLGTKTALKLVDVDTHKAKNALDYSIELAESALAEMRALIFELRPETLREDGLRMAFQRQAEALLGRHKIRVHLNMGNKEPNIPIESKEAVYRIGLEAIQNIIKHAGATVIEMRLAEVEQDVFLEIKDNGAGFDAAGHFPGHLGLKSMRERAAQVGGSLHLQSDPGAGTLIRVQVPLASAK